MRYLITYRPELQRDPELVEADAVSDEAGGQIVLRGTALVIGQPREVIVRRLRAADVASVEPEASDPPELPPGGRRAPLRTQL